jgi:tetratricopeptide (TPR) repeat protein
MKHLIILALSVLTVTTSAQNVLSKIDALLLNADYTQAIDAINNSSDLPAEARILLENKKAEALIHLGKFDEANEVLERAENNADKLPQRDFIKTCLETTQGFLYLNQGRNDLALDQLQQAITQFDLQGKGNSLESAQALSYLGQTYINTGKYVQAEEQLQRALTLRQNLLKNSNELIAASYNDLGLINSFLNDNDKALAYYEKALALYQATHEKEHPKIAIINTNMGVIYRNLELYGDAINNFENALTIWKKVYLQPHPAKAFVLSNLGQTYAKMSDLKTALTFYNDALKMYKESYGTKHPDQARVLNAIGNLKISGGSYDEALKMYQEALKSNVSDFNDDAIIRSPTVKNFYNGNVLLYSLLFKAQALESRYYGRTLKFKDLSMALNLLHICDTLVDKLRQQTTSESDKLALGVVANEVYTDGVRLAYSAGINSLSKKKYFEQAFYFAEKSKSAVRFGSQIICRYPSCFVRGRKITQVSNCFMYAKAGPNTFRSRGKKPARNLL